MAWPAPGLNVASAEARAQFLLRLRARGIRDLTLLRTLEAVPREIFVPHRYADLAGREVALPIACGQTMSAPFFVARMVEALRVTPVSRVLEIGSGSGYVSAILARLAREVIGFERYQGLVIEARTRLASLGLNNVTIVWDDGLAVPAQAGLFDRLVVHGLLEALPARLVDRLSPDAIVVVARRGGPQQGGKQDLLCLQRQAAPQEWRETILCPSRLRPLEVGRSQVL